MTALIPPTSTLVGMLDAMPDVVMVLASDGTIIATNWAFEVGLGHHHTDLVGRPVDALLTNPAGVLEAAVRAADGRRSERVVGVDLRRADGSVVTVTLVSQPLEWDGEVLALVTVDERRGAGVPARSASTQRPAGPVFGATVGAPLAAPAAEVPCSCGGPELAVFEEVAAAVLKGADGPAVLGILADRMRTSAAASTVGIARLADGGDALLVIAAAGRDAERFDGQVLELGGSVTAQALQMACEGGLGSDVVIVDDALMEAWTGEVDNGGGHVFVLPISAESALVGAVIAAGVQRSDEHIRRLRTLTVRAAAVMRFLSWQEHDRRMRVVDEQERIAREVHDAVIARLYGVGMQLHACVQSPSARMVEARVLAAVDTLDDVIRELRSTIFMRRGSDTTHGAC